jgi:hypothetical protein
MRTLTWPDAPHSFELTKEYGHPVKGVLRIVKPAKRQEIGIIFPSDINLDTIPKAWAAQDGKWVELFRCERPNFVAIRVIWLPDGQALVWTVLHVLDVPHDTLSLAPLTPDDWPKKIVAIASAGAS